MPPKLSGKQLAFGLLRILMVPIVILLPAGTWQWPEAWAVSGLYMAASFVGFVWLGKHDPALLAERSKMRPFQQGQKTWDKVVLAGFFPVALALYVLPGLDHRWEWTSVPMAVKAAAFVIHLPAMAWIGWVMKTNTYLSRVVKIDEERDHQVITTGPYAFVRHPMYSAVIVMFVAFPIALGSWIALIPAALNVVLLVVRTVLEDKTLHEELPGYVDYAQKTRCRLIPGIW